MSSGCACGCHRTSILGTDFPCPWCLDCFTQHGNPKLRLAAVRLRELAVSFRRVHDVPLADALDASAEAIDVLFAGLAACGLALRQDEKDPLAVISEILKTYDL